jgi:hypothetical protein
MDDFRDWRMWALGFFPWTCVGSYVALQFSASAIGPGVWADFILPNVTFLVLVGGFGSTIATLGFAPLIPFALAIEWLASRHTP